MALQRRILRSKIPPRRVESIQDNANPLKCSGGGSMMAMNLASPSERFGALDRFFAGEKHIRLIRKSSPICQTRHSGVFGIFCGARGAFLVAAAMVMSGCWSLAVGRRRCLRWDKPYTQVGIVSIYIPSIFFSSLKYLDRSKFYSGCPDASNTFYSIL